MNRAASFTFSLLMLLVGVALLLWGSAAQFEGEMRIATGSSESVAIRPTALPVATARRFAPPAMRTAAGAELSSGRTPGGEVWIDPSRFYDIIPLPFAVSVMSAKESKPRVNRGRIEVADGAHAATYDASVGSSIPAGSSAGTVVAIQPWSGLVEAAGNPPMAALVVTARKGAPPRDVLIPSASWVRADDENGVYFAWVATEVDARLLLDEGRNEAPSARWGAVDRGDTSWLRTFEPGSGLLLSDGTSITLLRREGARVTGDQQSPAIEVEIAGSSGTSRHWIRANAGESHVPVRYEDVSLLPRTVRVVSWEKNAALVQISGHGMEPVERMLGEGEPTEPDANGFSIRLDAALPAAVAVLPGSTALLEAVVDFPGRTVRLLEQRPAALNGVGLTFVPNVEPARVVYDLALTGSDGATQRHVLGPDASIRSGSWRIRQKPSRATSTELVDLAVTYAPARYAKRWGEVCLAITLGTLGLLIVRRFRPHSHGVGPPPPVVVL